MEQALDLSSEQIQLMGQELISGWIKSLSVEERLEGISEDKRLKGISEDKRLKGISEDKRLKGISEDKRLEGVSQQAMLKKLLANSTPEEIKQMLQQDLNKS